MSSHLLYVPTHRPSIPAIEAYAGEAQFLARLLREPVTFALIESRHGPWVEQHADLLQKLRVESQTQTFHVTVPAFARFCAGVLERAAISGGERIFAERLLMPRGVAYGAGPNKAALIGAALGSTTLHRRDSDTLPPHRQDGVVRYPGELEVRAIGRSLSDIALRDEASDSSEQVQLVGSAYVGHPPVDRRDLFEAGWEFARELEALSAGDDGSELDASLREYFVDEPGREYSSDFLELDSDGKLEMGASCVFELWRNVPEMPLLETLGSDYVQKNLVAALDAPTVFHSRKVRHGYDAQRVRSSPDSVAKYALRELRQLLLWHSWRAVQEAQIGAGESDAVGSWESFLPLLSEPEAVISRHELLAAIGDFVSIHQRAASASSGELAARLAAVAAAATDAGENLIDDVEEGLEDFAHLARLWPTLIAAAERSEAEAHVAFTEG